MPDISPQSAHRARKEEPDDSGADGSDSLNFFARFAVKYRSLVLFALFARFAVKYSG
jgi:hypothetical protein